MLQMFNKKIYIYILTFTLMSAETAGGVPWFTSSSVVCASVVMCHLLDKTAQEVNGMCAVMSRKLHKTTEATEKG